MKNKFIWFLLIILIGLSIYFFLIEDNLLFGSYTNVRLNNIETINRFVIKSDTSEISIVKQNENWMINKTYKANNQIINKLFRLFSNIEIAMLPLKDSIDYFSSKLKEEGNQILFYNSDKLIAKYWIGKYYPNKKSTLLMEESEKPVYVRAAGLTSDVQQYASTNIILWRNKQIFGFDINKFKSLSFTNHINRKLSFIIVNDENKYKLFNYNKTEVDFDYDKIKRYLSYFSNIEFETVDNKFNAMQIDSIVMSKSFYTINFELEGSDNFIIDLIAKPNENDSSAIDINTLYARIKNETQLLNIKYFTIDPIIKDISYFYKGKF